MHGITAPISGEGKFSSQPAYIEAIAGSGVKKNPGSGVLCCYCCVSDPARMQ
jgi:hypothetical protein